MGRSPESARGLKAGILVGEDEILEFCRSVLSHFKCPRSVEFLESLPKTGTGKVLKRELRKKYWRAEKNVVS